MFASFYTRMRNVRALSSRIINYNAVIDTYFASSIFICAKTDSLAMFVPEHELGQAYSHRFFTFSNLDCNRSQTFEMPTKICAVSWVDW